MSTNQINDIEVRDFVELKQTRVYVINTDIQRSSIFYKRMTDEEFMDEAELQGTVYSLEGFVEAFNNEEVDTNSDVIKTITK
jgi:hypothetical protein